MDRIAVYPDLIDLGILHVRTYGVLMATGFLACWWIIERLSGRKDLSNLLVSLMVCGIVGSRAAYVIEHWQSEFARHPEAIIRVDQGGLMFYGGFILAAAAFFRFDYDDESFVWEGKRHPLSDIKSVDRSKWKRKGIAKLILADGTKITLDAWHHVGVKDFMAKLPEGL